MFDGVLSNFFKAYEDLHVKVAGEDLFPARWPTLLPPTWNWPTQYGYTSAHTTEVWRRIKSSTTFWEDLEPLPGAGEAMRYLDKLSKEGHQVFFISDRTGINPKRQTEKFLYTKGFLEYPTVILSSNKAPVVHALGLDLYIDDKPETITAMCELSKNCMPNLRFYTISYPYNEKGRHLNARLVSGVKEMLEKEGLWTPETL